MRNIFLILSLIFLFPVANAQVASSTLRIGPKTAADKKLIFNTNSATPPTVKWNNSSSKIQFTNDGTNFKDLGSGSGSGSGVNLLSDYNGDFEAALGSWTSSGGSFTSETTNPLFGLASGLWDSSASAQTLSSQTVTINKGMVGRRCQMSVVYKWASGVQDDLSFQVYDGANTLFDLKPAPTSGSNSQKAVQYYDCGTSTSSTLQFIVKSNVTNPAAITLDNVFIGSDSGILTDKPQDVFSAQTDGASPSVVSNENKNWLNGDCTRNSTGNYTCNFVTGIFGSATPNCSCVVNSTSAASDRQCQLYSASSTQVSYITNGGAVLTDYATSIVCQNPISSANREALTLETSGWGVDATIGGGSISVSSGSVTSYTGLENASLTLVNNTGAKKSIAGVKIPCSSTNPSTGTTCAAGSESIGIAFTPPVAGTIKVCVDGSYTLPSSSIDNGITIQVVKTSNSAQTILEEGESKVFIGGNSGAANDTFFIGFHNCGNFSVDASEQTFRLFYEKPTATTGSAGSITADLNASAGQRNIHWTVEPIGQQFPAPVFTELQNVTKGGVSGLKVLSSFIANGGVPAVSQQDGTWINTITDNGVGNMTVNFTVGTFVNTPNCFCTAYNSGTNLCEVDSTSAISSSLVRLKTFTDAAVAADTALMLMCIGN